jgi:type IV pilus assembly protein PilV
MFGHQNATGFTLIEVLISTIILAIGLLGLAAMQTLALKDNQDAFFYTQASSLAYEMSDRIKVNPGGWDVSLPVDSNCPSPKLCTFADQCSPPEMAIYDYCAWKNNVQNRIIAGAIATVTQPSVVVVGSSCSVSTTKVCITISWARNHQQGTNTTNTFQLEVTP